MKYIKNFNENIEMSIEYWIREFDLQLYTINDVDGTVDVNGDVLIYHRKLVKIPIKFGIVEGNFYCNENKLITLKNCPRIIKGNFSCGDNLLTTLEWGPKEVGGDMYYCHCNKLISLYGLTEKFGKIFSCKGNPIYQIYKLFPNHKAYLDSLDYNYLSGTNIIKLRFQEACEEADILIPSSIFYYKYI